MVITAHFIQSLLMQNVRKMRRYVALRESVNDTLLSIPPLLDCPRTIMDFVWILVDLGHVHTLNEIMYMTRVKKKWKETSQMTEYFVWRWEYWNLPFETYWDCKIHPKFIGVHWVLSFMFCDIVETVRAFSFEIFLWYLWDWTSSLIWTFWDQKDCFILFCSRPFETSPTVSF